VESPSTPVSRLPSPVAERLRQISTATLTTQLFKLGFRNTFLQGLRPLCPEIRMVGVAVTLRFVPAREDLATFGALGDPTYPQRHVIEHIQAGEVLVVDCRGIPAAAAAGDILVARLRARGAAGLVADGGIRDYPAVQELGLPVYALGPSGPAHIVRHLAVDTNTPVGCAEVLVMPGDVLVGDAEGVVCIPRAVVETVAVQGLEQEELETFLLEKVKNGAALGGTYPPSAATLADYETWRSERRQGRRSA
jgi:regulator of RNase E activity RraA